MLKSYEVMNNFSDICTSLTYQLQKKVVFDAFIVLWFQRYMEFKAAFEIKDPKQM